MGQILILIITIFTLFTCCEEKKEEKPIHHFFKNTSNEFKDSIDKLAQYPIDRVSFFEDQFDFSGRSIKLKYKFIYDSEQENKFLKEIEIKTNDTITQRIKPKNKRCEKGFVTWVFNYRANRNNKVLCLEYKDSTKTFPFETWVYNSEKRLFFIQDMANTHILKNITNKRNELIIKEQLKMHYGKDYSTSISLVELSIYEKSKHFQTIKLNSTNGILEFEDWNFDGYEDISLFLDHGGSSCGGDGVFEIWLFNPVKNKFEYSEVLSNECIYNDLKNKRISFSYRSGAAYSSSNEMKWVGKKLVLDEKIEVTLDLRDNSDGKGHLLRKTITTQYIGNQKQKPLIETEFTDGIYVGDN